MTIATHPVTRRDLLSLAFILFVAAFMRLENQAGVVHFRYDQGNLSTRALDLVTGRNFPLVGVESSAGIPHSPMTVYALAVPYALTDSPFTVSVLIALWNVFGVGLLWLLGHRYFGPLVGAAAGLAYAVAPAAVQQSIYIWNPNMHTPLVLIGFLLALRGFGEGRRWAQMWALPILVIAAQLHYATWTLLGPYLWLVWAGRRSIRWPLLLASVALAALAVAPFVLGMALEPQAADDQLGEIAGMFASGLRFRLYPLEQVAELAIGMGVISRAQNGAPLLLQTVPRPDALWLLLGTLMLVGLAAAWRRAGRALAVWLWLWAFITPLVFVPAWTGSGVYAHFFIPTIPALMLAAGLGLAAVCDALMRVVPGFWWPVMRVSLLLAFCAILVTQAVWMTGYKRFLETTYTYSEDADGYRTLTPIRYLLDVRAALQPFRDVIIIGGSPHETDTYTWKAMLYNSAACVRDMVIDGSSVAVFPAGPFAAVVPPHAAPYEGLDLYVVDSPLVIPLRPGEDPYTIHAHAEAPAWDGPAIAAVDAPPFDNGAQLTGYALAAGRVYLRWHLQAAGGEHGYQYYAHFLDAAGERVGQKDAAFYSPRYWCPGDTLITWADTDIPSQTRTLRVGMYRFEGGGIAGAVLVGPDGGPAGGWVDISLPSA